MSTHVGDRFVAQEQVYIKAATDESFRNALFEDAHQALAAEGINIPADTEVELVSENPSNGIKFIVPELLVSEIELTDEELEVVAGGAASPDCTVLSCWTWSCIINSSRAQLQE